MKKLIAAATLASAVSVSVSTAVLAQGHDLERRIWALLDDARAPFVALPEPDFRALGADVTLPDGSRSVTALAEKAPGGAFDPRELSRIPARQLGYQPDWIVERFRRYSLDWDITALKLTSLDPEARNYPWFVIMNGGAANVYEFYVDLKNRPGWAQYLAQKMNVLIVTIPGNFKYGGWELPVMDERRQPAYVLDRDIPQQESEIRNAIFTNSLILQGVKQLLVKHTTGDLLLIGHSTSGEIAMLAYEDKELGPRLKGRYLGWGSGGPARLELLRTVKGKNVSVRGGASPRGARGPLHVLERRSPDSYARGYSGFLNPLYEAGMSHLQIAERWLAAEARRRPNFKQQLQNYEHNDELGQKAQVEHELEELLAKSGNPWRIAVEDVEKDLFVTNFTRMDGFRRMVWTTAHFDRNHWDPEAPMNSIELFVANEYRAKNPGAEIRVLNFDPPMTHYGHLELPRQLAAAHYAVVRWLVRPGT